MNKMYLGIVALVIVIGGAFLLSSRSDTSAAVSQTTSTATQTSVQVAPDFTLATIDSKQLSLADYKGKKAVVLDFWATWCPNCQRNIPHLETFYEKYKDSVEIIGVDLQEDPTLVKNFAVKYGITYPVVLDPSGVVSRAYGVRYTNYHVLIDKNGNIVGTIPGDISEDDISKLANL